MKTDSLSRRALRDGMNYMQAGHKEQYRLWQILAIWALAALPMGILSWVVFPAVSPDFASEPLGVGVTRMLLLTSTWMAVIVHSSQNVFLGFPVLGLVSGLA
ncbi:MAG: hypothetical protein ACM3QS_10255 [Bacteroidota bacterium]